MYDAPWIPVDRFATYLFGLLTLQIVDALAFFSVYVILGWLVPGRLMSRFGRRLA